MQDSERTSHRRKLSKRRVDSDNESEEDGDSDPLNISPRKENTISKRKRVSDSSPDLDVESQVPEHVEPTPQSLPHESTPPSRREKLIGSTKKTPRQKKKRTVVGSDEEDRVAEEESPDSPYHPSHDEDEDRDHPKEAKRSELPAKQKASTRKKPAKSGNNDIATKAKRGRAKKETKEILSKNEGDKSRNGQDFSQAQDDSVAKSARSRLKELTTEEANAPDSTSDPAAATTSEPLKVQTTDVAEMGKDATSPQPPQLPVKKKLPTIKKLKVPVTTPATAPPGTSKSLGIPHQVDAGEVGKLPTVETRIIAANVGSSDFDLRKPSVYAELFRPPGGSTPRSGLNRREKEEERRRELNKMRNEARAKRIADAKHVFDLQAQWDKISRFEERLRQEKSSVLFPNFLAAKFKDDWERQRRKDIDRDGTNRASAKDDRPKEEGELDSHS